MSFYDVIDLTAKRQTTYADQYVVSARDDANYSTDLGIVNLSATNVLVTLTSYDATGAQLASRQLTAPVPPNGRAMVTDALQFIAAVSATTNKTASIGVAADGPVASFGVLTVARWAFHQLKTNADVGSQSESASLLLQEYEQRGVGWLWQIDEENRVTYISSRMSALLGKPANQLLGHSMPALLGGHAELGRVLLEKQVFNSLEMELKTPRGTRWISIAGDPIVDTAGRFEGFRGVGSDITEIRQTQERLTHLANVDVLSGLPNRGRVRQLLGEALRHATTGNVPCAIMFLDLDGFKPVNDTFGHPKGDAVLRAVAKRLVDEVSADGHVGRMGGDEFAIVVTDAQSRKLVEQLADRIIKAIKEPYMIDQTEIRIGVSIGCAFGPIDGATVDDLILKADLALYQAKDAGKGCACYFSSALQSEQEDRVRLETDLRQAISP